MPCPNDSFGGGLTALPGYGFMINELPVILWNIITLLLALVILFFKIRFKE